MGRKIYCPAFNCISWGIKSKGTIRPIKKVLQDPESIIDELKECAEEVIGFNSYPCSHSSPHPHHREPLEQLQQADLDLEMWGLNLKDYRTEWAS
jgi:hypothetical protein